MKYRYILLVLAVAALQAACGSAPVERFYTLDALEPLASEISHPTPLRLSVGPVHVPDALDRPQMVWRAGAQQVVIAERSRWAEPLPSAISRVVADNLVRQTRGLIAVAPQTDADIRIELDIRRLDAEPGQAVSLEAVWLIRKSGHTTQGRALKSEPIAGIAIDDLVAAHERALESLSRDIAADLNQPSR